MKLTKFPYTRVIAKTGTIGGFLFENRHAGVPRTLFHAIEVPLAPFDAVAVDGKKKRTKTSLRFDSIELPEQPFRGYHSLVGWTYEFPLNPEPGYVDASIYLNGAHNWIDVGALSFTAYERGLLEVTIMFAIDFESEQSGYANTDALAVEVGLRPRPILIDPEIVKKAKRQSPHALLAPFVEDAILGDVVKEGIHVAVRLRESRYGTRSATKMSRSSPPISTSK